MKRMKGKKKEKWMTNRRELEKKQQPQKKMMMLKRKWVSGTVHLIIIQKCFAHRTQPTHKKKHFYIPLHSLVGNNHTAAFV